MAHRLFMIGIRWIKTPFDAAKVENVLGANGDWYRFNAYTWLFFTLKNEHETYNLLKPHFLPDDSILILQTDPAVHQGWAPKELWDWLEKNRQIIRRGF